MGPNATATLPTIADTHIPVGSLVTVTIGRNVRAGYSELCSLGHKSGTQVPMRRTYWDDFRALVTTALRSVADEVFGPFDGVGEWEGVSEESATFTALTTIPVSPEELGKRLGAIGGWYDQDAIAWSYGAARLARP